MFVKDGLLCESHPAIRELPGKLGLNGSVTIFGMMGLPTITGKAKFLVALEHFRSLSVRSKT
jgi:hypothetical protein